MHGVMQDVKFATRGLLRAPLFTVAALITLALGIGANTAIFSVVNHVLLEPLPFRQPDRVVMVWQTDLANDSPREAASAPDFLDWKREAKSFENLAGLFNRPVNLTSESASPERLTAAAVSFNLFDLLGRPPALGRSFHESEDRIGAAPVAVIGHELWQQRFGGDPGIIGESVRLDNMDFTIVGVAQAEFDMPGADLWTPLMPFLPFPDVRGVHNVRVIGRLTEGVSIEAAQAEMDAISKNLEQAYPEDNIGRGSLVEPLKEVIVSRVRPALLVLLGAVGLVLLIACANVSSLMMTRAGGRVREIAIRASLGATRARIARLLLTESLTLGILGGAGGVAAGFGMIRLLLAFQPGYLPRAEGVELDFTVLLFAALASLLSSVLFGLAPAIHASSRRAQAALRAGFGPRTTDHSRRTRDILVIGQVALAVVVVTGSGLLLKTLRALTTVDPGFRAEGVLSMDLTIPEATYPAPGRESYPEWPDMVGFYDRALERIQAVPGVTSAALALNHPLNAGFTSQVTIAGRPEPAGPIEETRIRPVTPNYFAVTGVPLISGRLVNERDRHGAPEALVVNQAFAAKYFPGENPVGASVNFWGLSREIVGVVGDVHFRGLDRGVDPAVYPSLYQLPMGSMSLLIEAETPEALVRDVREAVWSIEPDLAFFNVETMSEKLSSSVGAQRFHAILIGLFGGLALFLAAVGSYGLIAYQVLQRTSEIGIRVALGATYRNVLALVLSDGLRVTVAGILFGILGAVFLTRLLDSLLFGVSATDTTTFVLVPVILALIGLGACFVPAFRAARINPARALRCE